MNVEIASHKDKYTMIHLYEIARIDKFIETEHN